MSKWDFGDVVSRREVKGFDPLGDADPSTPWFDKAWIEVPARIVHDEPTSLAIYVAAGTEFHFPAGEWEAGKTHPWRANGSWQGHGTLMVQDPAEHHSVWHFWAGDDRSFACWYINIQTALRRGDRFVDTQDLELDIIVWPDGRWEFKDWELLDTRVDEKAFTPALADWIRDYGTALGERLDADGPWWDTSLTTWTPPDGWDLT